jgi:hypothetical protein
MPTVRLALALALAAVISGRSAGAAAEPQAAPDSSGMPAATRVVESTAVPMDLSSGKPVVAAIVNGKGPFRFFLDSAAGITVLDSAFAKELGLVAGREVRLGDPANPAAVRAQAVTIDSLRLGGATFAHFEAVAFDRSRLDAGEPDAPRGVLGFPLFHDVLLTLDYPNQVARVSHGALQRVGARDVLPLMVVHGVPTVTIEVAGRRLEAHLDAGSPGALTLPATLQDSIPLAGPLRDFRLGTHTFDSLTVRFLPEARANLGSGVLNHYAVTFDQKRGRVRLAYAAAAAARPADTDSAALAARGFGVRLRSLANGNVEVVSVEPGSPAQETGVEPGDVVIGIDGRAISAMTPEERTAAWLKPSLMLNVRRGDKRYGFTLLRPATKP